MIENLLYITGSAPVDYPIEIVFSLLTCECDNAYEVPRCVPFLGNEWGDISSTHIPERISFPTPNAIDLLWLALAEEKVYSIENCLDVGEINSCIDNLRQYDSSPLYIIVGYAPLGRVYLWVKNNIKSIIVFRGQAKEILNSNEIYPFLTPVQRISTYCKNILHKKPLLKFDLFDKYMQQFTYRYLPLFEKWDEDKTVWQKYGVDEAAPNFDYIEEVLFDGTHDKLHDGGLIKYHQAGKPKKIRIEWHIGKSEYSAYFWFEEERIRDVFDKFYGAHPDTKTDFIIRIDAEQKKYELSLYRYGLKDPQVIPEDVYQLLVFKNKFEDYRSENYNKERGAWIW